MEEYADAALIAFLHTAGWNNSKHVFLSAIFIVPVNVQSTVWKYQEIRTLYKEQLQAEIAKKLRTAQPQPKVTGSYLKKSLQRATCIQKTC